MKLMKLVLIYLLNAVEYQIKSVSTCIKYTYTNGVCYSTEFLFCKKICALFSFETTSIT